MDWKALGETLAKVGLPLLGNAVIPGSGPFIALITSKLGLAPDATPDQIAAAAASPDNLVKLQELQDKHEETLLTISLNAQTTQVDSINKTLQTEAMGGSWMQRNHHAMESSGTVILLWCVYFILPILKIPVPTIPGEAWLMLGGILGVTAWQRGAANVATARNGS